MVTQTDFGTLSAAVGATPDSLATKTTAGVWCLRVDTNNMVGSSIPSIVILAANTKATSTSTARQEWSATFIGVQADPNKYSPPIPSVHSIEFTLNQTQGSSKTYDWSVLQVDA